MLPATGWVPQNLIITPKTVWTKLFNQEYQRDFYTMSVSALINFVLPAGASKYHVTLVPARLCSRFTTMNILTHIGACGAKQTVNQVNVPVLVGLYGSAGDLMCGVISVYDAAGNFSYSAPFQFQQPIGDNPDPSFVPFCQTPGCMESDYCKAIEQTRTGTIAPSLPTASPTPTGRRKNR